MKKKMKTENVMLKLGSPVPKAGKAPVGRKCFFQGTVNCTEFGS